MAHIRRTTIHAGLLATLAGSSVALAQLGEPGPSGPAPVHAIFAPGTDPAYMARINAQLDAYNASIAAVDDQTGPRWPGTLGTPLTIRWSFVPDGTYIPPQPGETILFGTNSSLFSKVDTATLGGRSVWIDHVRAAMDRWTNLGGVTLTRVIIGTTDFDDGANWGNPGLSGRRGDIRIGMRNIDGPGGVLAYAIGPNDGDIILDGADIGTLANPFNDYVALRNVITRSVGIALGLEPECIQGARSIMEPILPISAIDGPQDDDIRGLHRLYGDAFGTKNTAASAIAIGSAVTISLGAISFTPTSAGSSLASLLSLHDSTQSDYFHFTVTKPVEFSATVQQLPSNYETAPYSAANGCGPFSPAGPATPDLTIDLTDSTGTTTLIHGDQTFSTTITSAGDYLMRISTLSRDNFIRPYLLNTLAIPACRFTDTFGTLTACTGASMTLSAPLVSVGPFTLQWYHDTTPIPGATSTTLVIDPLTPNDEGYYSCVAATPCGELTSAGTYLSVRTPRVGATSPASQTWTEGQTAKFQVTFTNGSAPYTSLQWMHDGQPIAGATGTTLLLPRLKLSDAGSYTFSFTTMCNSGVSAPGTLTVNPHCYADCDGSFSLSAIDFACFLDKFTARDPYANCDGSTTPPTLNAGDFVCFLQKFRAGCQ